MVVGIFPALKLGVLFVKQISKPLAQLLVNQAKNHPVFRTYFIIPPAQFYHWMEVKAKMYVMNLGKPTKVAKLNEAMAIELGANLMGEVIIFSVAGACLILEYNRQVTKEAKKEEARLAQLQKFSDDIEHLHKSISQQEAEIRYLQNVIKEIGKHTKHKVSWDMIVKTDNSTLSQQNVNDKSNKCEKPEIQTHNVQNDTQSIINRAIVYYKNDVKMDRHS